MVNIPAIKQTIAVAARPSSSRNSAISAGEKISRCVESVVPCGDIISYFLSFSCLLSVMLFDVRFAASANNRRFLMFGRSDLEASS
jgi:hypothetical protein